MQCRSRFVVLLTLTLVSGLLACAPPESAPPADAESGGGSPAAGAAEPAAQVETDHQKIMYTLGLAIAESLPQFSLTEDDLPYVMAGVRDRALNREAIVDQSTYGPMLAAYAQQKVSEAAAAEAELSTAFLDRMASEGYTRSDSGLLYQEVTAGTGASPTAESTVVVHYAGSLRTGAVFDSSYERGEPVTMGLKQGVIACWREGLQLIKVGGKGRLICPPDLAYGAQGRAPKILPNAALVFDIELLDIQQ